MFGKKFSGSKFNAVLEKTAKNLTTKQHETTRKDFFDFLRVISWFVFYFSG